MCALAELQNWPEQDVGWFSQAEESRISAYKLPGESKRKFGGGATYYPRYPVESPAEWFKNHYAKLRGLELAAGMP
jgi:hypothetical protein